MMTKDTINKAASEYAKKKCITLLTQSNAIDNFVAGAEWALRLTQSEYSASNNKHQYDICGL